jgi:multisubunit Na+/H+ antiporter MnhB subunit
MTLSQPPRNRDAVEQSGVRARLGGAFAALAMGAILLIAVIVALNIFRVSQATQVAVGVSFAAPLAGLFLAGWKRPLMFLQPLQRVSVSGLTWIKEQIDSRLTQPAQRALFAFAIVCSLPWMALGLIVELWESSSAKEYGRSVFFPLLNTVFDFDRSYAPRWFDWAMLVAVVASVLAFSWRFVAQPLAAWVLGRQSK